jgi:hypothetical protein
MKTALWLASLTATQAGKNSRINCPKHTIKSITLTDLIFRENVDEE